MKSLILALYCVFTFHDFHTSLTEVNYNSQSRSLELSVRVFTDDLEIALTNFNKGKSVKMEEPSAKVDPIIEQYFRRNLAIISPDKEVKFAKFYGKEQEADATWLYFEVFEGDNIKDFTLYNAIMQELFKDQTNLVNIMYPGKKKTLVFDSEVRVHPWPF